MLLHYVLESSAAHNATRMQQLCRRVPSLALTCGKVDDSMRLVHPTRPKALWTRCAKGCDSTSELRDMTAL
jgi:hypothetical protein